MAPRFLTDIYLKEQIFTGEEGREGRKGERRKGKGAEKEKKKNRIQKVSLYNIISIS